MCVPGARKKSSKTRKKGENAIIWPRKCIKWGRGEANKRQIRRAKKADTADTQKKVSDTPVAVSEYLTLHISLVTTLERLFVLLLSALCSLRLVSLDLT